MAQYGHTKLMLTTFAQELTRRLRGEQGADVGVYTLCPGAVSSDIARDAPRLVQLFLKPIMRTFFASPAKAAEPALYLAAAAAMENRSGVYFHCMRECLPSEAARDAEAAQRLWQESERLIAEAQAG